MSEALLVTGAYGSGKTSVIAEIAEILEETGDRYAAIDLDWLAWGSPGGHEDGSGHRLMLMNLAPMVANYTSFGVTRFVMAGFFATGAEVARLRSLLGMPLHVVGLDVPWEELERRLGADPTRGRATDLVNARAFQTAGLGSGFEDLTVSNHHRPLADVADEILRRVGWD